MPEETTVRIKVKDKNGNKKFIEKQAHYVGKIFAATDGYKEGYSVTHLATGYAVVTYDLLESAITALAGIEALYDVDMLDDVLIYSLEIPRDPDIMQEIAAYIKRIDLT